MLILSFPVFQEHPIAFCVWWGYAGLTLIQILLWILLLSRAAVRKMPAIHLPEMPEPVSLIICARNEAENLKKNLCHFLNQNYRCFEVIVVNDASTDRTLEVLLDIQNKSRNLRIINFTNKKVGAGKKAALAAGIHAARYDLILLSDADCKPAGDRWMAHMTAAIQGSSAATVGLGYGPYYKLPGLLNRFIRFETVYTALQYLSFALVGLPYMGVGRNLTYRKDLFLKTGFSNHMHLASGDDDLFVNQVAAANRTAVVIHPEAFTFSAPKENWRAFARQKSRHLSTATSYRPVHQVLLGFLAASHLGHYALLMGMVCAGFSTIFDAFLLYVLRMCILLWVYAGVLKKLQEKDLLKWVPILDVLLAIYFLLFAIVPFKRMNPRWN